MRPTDKGRLCGQCEKEIYDFSAMSWPAIARTQAAHGNTLCGMYSPAQLAHWGQAPPTCAQLLAATTLALTLANLPAVAQAPAGSAAAPELTLRGTVFAPSATGKVEPVPFVTVFLPGTTLGTSTNEVGQYTFTIPATGSQPDSTTVLFSNVGYHTGKLVLPRQACGLFQQDVYLAIETNLEIFSVSQPSLRERMNWRLKRWFATDKGKK